MYSYKYIKKVLFSFLLMITIVLPSYSHMMEAQHGTLNFFEDGAFMVLSLPISSFDGIDDNNDGKLSMLEFNTHRLDISKSIIKNVTLSDKIGNFLLQGIMLSPSESHDSPKKLSSQIIVMGRFKLERPNGVFKFKVNLFGNEEKEKSIKITATRKSHSQKNTFNLTEKVPSIELFSSK